MTFFARFRTCPGPGPVPCALRQGAVLRPRHHRRPLRRSHGAYPQRRGSSTRSSSRGRRSSRGRGWGPRQGARAGPGDKLPVGGCGGRGRCGSGGPQLATAGGVCAGGGGGRGGGAGLQVGVAAWWLVRVDAGMRVTTLKRTGTLLQFGMFAIVEQRGRSCRQVLKTPVVRTFLTQVP